MGRLAGDWELGQGLQAQGSSGVTPEGVGVSEKEAQRGWAGRTEWGVKAEPWGSDTALARGAGAEQPFLKAVTEVARCWTIPPGCWRWLG